MTTRRAVVGVSALGALVLGGCGQASQSSVLAQASQNLSRVRSGNLDLRMAVTGGDTAAAGQVGFEERGPFSLPSAGTLPVAQTEVIHFVGSQQDSTTFISTGKDAYISNGGHAYALPPATVQALRQASTGAPANLAGLQLDRWATGGSVSDGGKVDGVVSDHVVAGVNVLNFLNDLMQLARGLGQGASVPQVSPQEAQDLARVVRSSHLEAWTGRDDHLLRKLTVGVDFASATSDPNSPLARYSRTHLELDLSLGSVNQPVTVNTPSDVQPFTAFCARQPDAGACKKAQS